MLKRGCDGPDTVNWKLNLEVAGVHLLRTYISTIRRCKCKHGLETISKSTFPAGHHIRVR